jgi:hypothetical protein
MAGMEGTPDIMGIEHDGRLLDGESIFGKPACPKRLRARLLTASPALPKIHLSASTRQ